MNKYQKALDDLDVPFESYKLLKELVEKATPKKPIKETGRWDLIFYKCPTCSKNLGWSYDSKAKYCDDCGQRIDWSK